MLIFPAIDLIGGEAVRLVRGDYEQKTVYSSDPVRTAQSFYESGARFLHVVDLDGAKSGGTDNAETVRALIEESGMAVEIGGGVRNMSVVRRYIESGAWRVILGTAAVDDPELLRRAVGTYGEKIAVGVDIRGSRVMTRGWMQDGGLDCDEFCHTLQTLGVKTVICTDISRDGMMAGANGALYARLAAQFPKLDLVASGGVSSYADIQALAAQNLYGAIVGKALYTGAVDLARAVQIAEGGKA